MATLCVGGFSSCGSLIQGQCLAQPCKAEVRANDGSTTPHRGSLILCSHSWLPFTPPRSIHLPLSSPVFRLPGWGIHCFLFSFLSPLYQPVSKAILGCLLVSNLSMSLAHGVSVCPAQCWGGTCVCPRGPWGPCVCVCVLTSALADGQLLPVWWKSGASSELCLCIHTPCVCTCVLWCVHVSLQPRGGPLGHCLPAHPDGASPPRLGRHSRIRPFAQLVFVNNLQNGDSEGDMLLELEIICRGEILAWVAAECRKACAEDLVSVRCPRSCGCRRALGKLILSRGT